MAKTAPIETLTARRYSGSAQRGDRITASTPRAAAHRKMAPTLAWSTRSSSTRMRLGGARRRAPPAGGASGAQGAAVHPVTGEPLGHLVGDHVDRGVTRRQGGQIRAPGLGDQDRAEKVAGRDGAGDYLGDRKS